MIRRSGRNMFEQGALRSVLKVNWREMRSMRLGFMKLRIPNRLSTALVAVALSWLSAGNQGNAQSPFGAFARAGTVPKGGYNSFNGSLGAYIPVYHVGGRGNAGFDIVFNPQPNWKAVSTAISTTQSAVVIEPYPSTNIASPASSATFGLFASASLFSRTGGGMTVCGGGIYPSSTLTTVVFAAGNGTQLTLVDTATNGAVYNIPNPCSFPLGPYNAGRGTVFRSKDGSQIQFTSDSAVLDQRPGATLGGGAAGKLSGVLQFPDGHIYRFDNSTLSYIRDRNGNQTTFSYTPNSDPYLINSSIGIWTPAATQITDSLGRITTINYTDTTCGSNCATISYTGTADAARQIKIYYGTLQSNLRTGAGYALESFATLFSNAPGHPPITTIQPWPRRSYFRMAANTHFQYNSFGELARVVYPAGGATEYDYGDGNNGNTGGYQSGSSGVMVYRRLRRVEEQYSAGGTGTTYDLRTHYTVSYPRAKRLIHRSPTMQRAPCLGRPFTPWTVRRLMR